MAGFRPIRLCNTIYKLVTKIISSRLRPILDNIISPLQYSFIKERAIKNNVIIVKEVAHVFHKCKKDRNIMTLKLDLIQDLPYFTMEFIRDTLVSFHFWTHLFVLSCVVSLLLVLTFDGTRTLHMNVSQREECDKVIFYPPIFLCCALIGCLL